MSTLPSPATRIFHRGYTLHDHAEVDAGCDPQGARVFAATRAGLCPICKGVFGEYRASGGELSQKSIDELSLKHPGKRFSSLQFGLLKCPACGWWQVGGQAVDPFTREYIAHWYAELGAVIEAVDISSTGVAIEDLRNHLRDRWDDRRFISAKRAEDLVAGVLADNLGTDVVRVTANAEAPDGGVDLYVCTAEGVVSAAV